MREGISKNFQLKCVVVFTAILICIFNWESQNRQKTERRTPASRGVKDDLEGRYQYELQRLRDPATGTIPASIRRKELTFSKSLPVHRLFQYHKGTALLQSQAWTFEGPDNIGGRTRALAIDIADENNLLAGGVSGGMFRSSDGGVSWLDTSDPLVLHSISCLVQDTRTGMTDVWYYGTGEYRGNSASGGGSPFRGDGIYKSTDNGKSWTVLASTNLETPHLWDGDFDYIWNLAVDPSNDTEDVVYAAVYGGIMRSTDGGISWTAVLGSLYSGPYTDIAITSTGICYATLSSTGSRPGIWRSTTGQSGTWAEITPSGWPSEFNRVVIGIAPSNENVVYFLAETEQAGLNGHSFWKYTYIDGDGTGSHGYWENRSANLPAYGNPVGNYDSQGSYDMLVKVRPDDEDIVFIGGTNLYRSTDGFVTNQNIAWVGGYATSNSALIMDNHYPDQHALVFYPSDTDKMLSGNDGGVFQTDNNLGPVISWTSLNHGYITTQYYTVALDHTVKKDKSIIGGLQDRSTYIHWSGNPTKAWELTCSGDGSFCAMVDSGVLVYPSSQYGRVRRYQYSTNREYIDWTQIWPTNSTGHLFVNPFMIDPNDSRMMFYPAGRFLWRNHDVTQIPWNQYGTTVNWTRLDNSMTENTISAITVCRDPAHRIYYGTTEGEIYRLDNAHTGNPIPINIFSGKGLPTGGLYVSCIAADPEDGDKAIVVFSNYSIPSLFYTDNAGQTWTDISGNLEEWPDGSGSGPSCRWAVFAHSYEGPVYFAGTSTGLYSADHLDGSGTIWSLEAGSLIGNAVVDMLDYRLSDGFLVVATHGKGIYSTEIKPPNRYPAASHPAIEPPLPFTTDHLTAVYDYFDLDGDPEGDTRIEWFRDETAQPSYDNRIFLPHSATAKGESWYFSVTPYDGMAFGESVFSESVFIRNSPPTVPKAGILPDKPETNDTLHIEYSFYDADGDIEGVPEIRWYKNGKLQAGLNDRLHVSPEHTVVGESWFAGISPNDGEVFGDTACTAVVLIEPPNQPPAVTDILITPNPPKTTDNLTVSYIYSDPDDDPEGHTKIEWFRDGSHESDFDGFLTIGSDYTLKNESWSVRVKPSDGKDDGAADTSGVVVIQNSAPEALDVQLLPGIPAENDTLRVDYRYSDADGDPESGTGFIWSRNGQPVDNFINQSFVLPEETEIGEVWICRITPSDGFTSGNPVESAPVTIQIGSDITEKPVPDSFVLMQNHPNPFNPETQIRFGLPRLASVRLDIFNIQGEYIVTLVDGQKEAGYHRVRWNGRDAMDRPVCGGLYLCRIRTEGFNKTVRMLYLK